MSYLVVYCLVVPIFVKNDICHRVKLIRKGERFIILQLGDLVLVNVYLPSSGSGNLKDDFMNCLAMIANELSELRYKYIILGGDLNIDFTHTHYGIIC